MGRPRVTKIEVTVTDQKGKEKTYDVNPFENVALFWGDLEIDHLTDEPSVTAILGNFYDNVRTPIEYPFEDFKKEFNKEFGEGFANKFYNSKRKKEKLFLNKELIRKIWETKDKSGQLKAYIVKKPKCYFGF